MSPSPIRFYVAIPYGMNPLSEPEQQREIGEYLSNAGYRDFAGFSGDVEIEGAWYLLCGFDSRTDADRFLTLWGGLRMTGALEAKVTRRRWSAMETPEDLKRSAA